VAVQALVAGVAVLPARTGILDVVALVCDSSPFTG